MPVQVFRSRYAIAIPKGQSIVLRFSSLTGCRARPPQGPPKLSQLKLPSHSCSESPKPHPSKPHPCNMPQAKTEVALQFLECCAAETALQHALFCSVDVICTKSCAAANEKLHCNIEIAALQESGAFLPLSCGFQAPMFRHPRFGLADLSRSRGYRSYTVASPGLKRFLWRFPHLAKQTSGPFLVNSSRIPSSFWKI